MKKIIFIVLIFLICQNVLAEKITYKIKPYFSSLEPYILIDLEYIADSSGETKLLLPSNWVDLKNPADDFYDINISPNAFTRKKNYFLVYSKPNEPITIQYKIKHQADHAFKTKITHSYFQFIGKTVFILPDVSFDKKQEML